MKFIAIVNRAEQVADGKYDLWQEAFEVSDTDSIGDLCRRIKDRSGHAGEIKILPVITAERGKACGKARLLP